ncbi:MAG: hypothetical protein HC840_18075 [Leptolyngbyaceae cyanobacterium RM2_2_4]|nr:hypothetical protein [Leptolyngbyaceae cyanobacterium SM1_4_3]NJO51036.1 hypothetical protein [Leptolyngbyaceae cyanobacterium RM2_2_4]
MSDRYFNNFNDFNDDFEDDFDDDDDFLEDSDLGAREIGGDRNSAALRPFIQEIEQIPPEHLANLLQIIRLFRQSVALTEQTAQAKAAAVQDSPPIQPTVLPPVELIDTTPTDAIPIDAAPTDSGVTSIDPIEKLLRRSQFKSPDAPTTDPVTPLPTEPPQEPPLIPLRLPQTSAANAKPAEPTAEPAVEVVESVEYAVKPETEDESDWDELMDFLDQDTPKDFREENGLRDNDWDEYFRPSP